MKPLLKRQDCVDHDPIEKWEPSDGEPVDYWLCLHIGTHEGLGADIFNVNVLTEATADQMDEGILAKRKTIVVRNYSWSAVMREVDQVLSAVEGESWEEIAQKLSRSFHWEFENYKS